MQLSEMDSAEIYYAALVHDIGMLVIPEDIIDATKKAGGCGEEFDTHTRRTDA